MKFKALFATAAIAAAVCATHAWADNEPEPTGTQILNLNGQAIPHAYTQYTADFVATDASTNLSFAFREDPAFLFLDDVSLTDVTTSSGELVTNGGFEDGVVGASAPNGWTYLNVFGAAFGGVVENNAFIANGAHSGDNYYYDGAVQAYDAITQNIATTAGDHYHLTFWLNDNSNGDVFRHISDNGQPGTGGNGINLVVYAGGVPVRTPTPEPAAWALMMLGFGGLGAALRRKSSLATA